LAVTSVIEVWDGRTAKRNASNEREYTRTFKVFTSAMTDGPGVVGDTRVTGIPHLFAFYDDHGSVDFGARVHDYQLTQTDDPFCWLVKVLYSSSIHRAEHSPGSGRSGKAEQADKGSTDDNPINRPASVKFSLAKYQKVTDYDSNQTAYKNAAGEYFKPRPQVDATRLVVTIDRNEYRPDLTNLLTYQDVLNRDPWLGTQAGQCKLNMYGESAHENGLLYYKMTYVIEVRQRDDIQFSLGVHAWDLCIANVGANQLDPVSGKLVKIVAANNGESINGQFPLGAQTGSVLPPGSPANFIPFVPYKSVNFAPLGIP